MQVAQQHVGSLSVCVEISELAKAHSSIVTGVLYVELDGAAFPEAGWNDAVVRVLTDWCQACLLFGSNAKRVEFLFQDGSFGWDVCPMQKLADIECYSWSERRTTILTGRVELKDVLEQTTRAARQVWSACVRSGLASSEVLRLEDAWRKAAAHANVAFTA